MAVSHLHPKQQRLVAHAETARQDAALAEAEGRTDDAARLRTEAEHQAGAARAYTRVVEARSEWAGRTVYTRINGEAAKDELTRRGIAPGHEPDRTTARVYLTPADTADERALIHADDAHRDITDADVTDLHPDDHAWAARTAADAFTAHEAPEAHVGQPAPTTVAHPAGQSPAYHVIAPGMSRVQLDVLLAQAQLALTIAVDQASQDQANKLAGQPNRAFESFQAGLRRRDAAALDAQAQGYDAGLDAQADLYLDQPPDTDADFTQEYGA